MGAPNNELIAPAVLLENPGLTQVELIDALDETRSSINISCALAYEWGEYGMGKISSHDEYPIHWVEDSYFHQGVFGLTQVLALRPTKYRTRYEVECEQAGVSQNEPYFTVVPVKEGEVWKEPGYRIVRHIGDSLGDPRRVESNFVEEPAVGKLFFGGYQKSTVSNSFYPAAVRICKVFSKERMAVHGMGCDMHGIETSELPWKADVEVQDVRPIHDCEFIASLNDLRVAHPDIDPERMYDFSQERGSFGLNRPQNPQWIKRNSRYYLDTDALWRDNREHLYTSIVLTSEAIKHKAWNLLCYDGGRHVERFLADVPAARKRYDRSVLHWWVTKHIHSIRGTNSDFIRLLIDARIGARSVQPADDIARSIAAVEAEGFGWGRYLHGGFRNSFSDEERATLTGHLLTGMTMTNALRSYLRVREPASIIQSDDSVELPF